MSQIKTNHIQRKRRVRYQSDISQIQSPNEVLGSRMWFEFLEISLFFNWENKDQPLHRQLNLLRCYVLANVP